MTRLPKVLELGEVSSSLLAIQTCSKSHFDPKPEQSTDKNLPYILFSKYIYLNILKRMTHWR